MIKTIRMTLSDSSIADAIKQIEAYTQWVVKKTELLTQKLADIGMQDAQVTFAGAQYDGDNDVSVTVRRIPKGYAILAEGQAVCFIEFGAGVYYNGDEPYPVKRPSGISKIGEYGQGRGKRRAWGFYDDGGQVVVTRGNPAAMPMYGAQRTMYEAIARIAKEVFG